jgi:DedD protein
MKLVMDEKLKHRIVGLAVIASLCALFAPTVMRQSSQKLEGNFSVHVTMPKKPVAPDVVLTDEKEVFKTIRITRVALANVPDEKQLPQLVHAESLKPTQTDPIIEQVQNVKLSVVASAHSQLQLAQKAQKKAPPLLASNHKIASKVVQNVVHGAKKEVILAKSSSVKQAIYEVQLASFLDVKHAEALLIRLHSKGYRARVSKVLGNRGSMYKVYAGQSPHRNDIEKLKSQLADTMKLNGFIVNTGIS